jgi:hypothetical protein
LSASQEAILIQLVGSSSDSLITIPNRGILSRTAPLWKDKETLTHVQPIRYRARKFARAPYTGSLIIAASNRVERGGLPQGYRLTDTAREFAVIEDAAQLVTILAGRLGNPGIAPNPPVWPLLAMLLMEWGDVISAQDVLDRATRIGATEEVNRGLIIMSYLFPELHDWLSGVRLHVPFWERTLAIPFAARKLVLLEKTR